MNPLHQKAFDLREQWRKSQPYSSWSEQTKEKLINDFTYHSTKIEGLSLNYGDTLNFLRKGIIKGHENLKDVTNLKNHKEVLRYIFTSYDHIELNVETIKDLHRMLMSDPVQWDNRTAYSGGPGEFKRENNFGFRGDCKSKEYLDWMHVPTALEKLCSSTNELLQDDKSLLSAIHHFHYQFANEIHPFGDGNGRLVRLIHNLLLLKNGFPVMMIRASDKNRYIKAIIAQETELYRSAFDDFLSQKLIESLNLKVSTSF